jgi:hypothetical protein
VGENGKVFLSGKGFIPKKNLPELPPEDEFFIWMMTKA